MKALILNKKGTTSPPMWISTMDPYIGHVINVRPHQAQPDWFTGALDGEEWDWHKDWLKILKD